jgi:hypothetical protein
MSDLKIPAVYAELEWQERRAVREKYVELQRGLCHHCGAPLTGPALDAIREKRIDRKLYPPNFFKYPVHLHHSHDTGLTIGAVHNYCNAVLWEHHGE